MFNINDDKFDSKEGSNVAIFNDGKAGAVDNVTVSIKRKTPEDKEKAPNYKITFTDASGASIEMPFWYVEAATDYASVEQQVEKQGKSLKHILKAIYGEGNIPPVTGTTAKEFLDSAMKAIHEGLKAGGKFRVFANYGTLPNPEKGYKGSISKYLGIRSWVPFMEPMSVPASESRLKPGSIDAMERLEETPVAPPAASASLDEGDDW